MAEHPTISAYFVRHGIVNGNDVNRNWRADPPLTSSGDIEALGNILKDSGTHPSIIYTSPYERCIQTADILAKILNTRFHKDERLRERAFELESGKYFPSNPYETEGFSIESWQTITARMLQIWYHAVTTHPKKELMFVSHGDPLAFLLWALLNQQKKPDFNLLKHFPYMLGRGDCLKVDFTPELEVVNYKLFTPIAQNNSISYAFFEDTNDWDQEY